MKTLSHAEHLALYSAFHRDDGNRALHVVALAGVLFSGSCLAVRFCWPVLVVALVVQLASMVRLHAFGGVAASVMSAVWAGLAVLVARHVPTLPLVAGAVVLHVVSWWALVVVGHERLERTLETPSGAQDSNYYFRQQLYLARNLGFAAGVLDTWTQFAISPLASAWDVLEFFGVQNPEEAEIRALRADVLERIAQGLPPFAVSRATSAPGTVASGRCTVARAAS